MASILPFLAAMIVVQDVTALWELHRQKIEEVAKEQEEAVKSMMEANDKLIASTKALDDALHPTKNDTEKDQKALEQKEASIKQQFENQKALNKANEDAELSTATNEQQKAAIKEKYRQADQNLQFDEARALSQADQNAANDANKQIAALRAREAQLQATSAANDRQVQADADKKTKEGDLEGAAVDKQAMASDALWLAGQLKNLREQAGSLGAFAENTGEKATSTFGTAVSKYQTQTAVADTEASAKAQNDVLDKQDASHETLRQLLNRTGATHDQISAIVTAIIDRHVTLEYELRYQKSRLDNLTSHTNNTGAG